jgi:hypothetical protein
VPRATRTTRITQPGTVIINPLPATPQGTTVETTTEPKKDFWEAQQILNAPEGRDYCIYLYRLQPAMLGHKGYIAKFSQPVTMEEIKESFGGYEYRISLHKGSKWICQDVFSVSAPPKAIGTADPAMFAGMSPNPNTGAEATAQVSQVLAFVNERLDKERRDKANDPAYLASLDLVRESAKQAITAAYSQTRNPAAESMQNQMMQMMMTQMGQVTSALLTRSLERPERGSVSGIRELLDLLPLLGVKIGGGGGRVDPLTDIGRSLISAAPQILEAGAVFMDKYRQIAAERTRQAELQFNAIAIQRGQQPVTVSVREVPGQAAPPPKPAAAARPDGFNVVDFPSVSVGPQPAAAAPAAAATTAAGFDGDLVKRRIVELIHRGMSGDALMAFISGVNEDFAKTMKVCSEEQIRGFFAGDAILSQALTSPNFDQCLSEAIEYLHSSEAPQPVN